MGRRIPGGESAFEREEDATRWIRVVLGWLIPACGPDDASPMIFRLRAARREALSLRGRLERQGRPPTEVAAAIRAHLLAAGLERHVGPGRRGRLAVRAADMSHVVFDVRPDERAELLAGLNTKALTQLAPPPAGGPDRHHREYVRVWAERQRVTSACLFCEYVRRDVLLAEARREFSTHSCARLDGQKILPTSATTRDHRRAATTRRLR
jgi:hypothetical protein